MVSIWATAPLRGGASACPVGHATVSPIVTICLAPNGHTTTGQNRDNAGIPPSIADETKDSGRGGTDEKPKAGPSRRTGPSREDIGLHSTVVNSTTGDSTGVESTTGDSAAGDSMDGTRTDGNSTGRGYVGGSSERLTVPDSGSKSTTPYWSSVGS